MGAVLIRTVPACGGVLAYFDPEWPVLNYPLAYFETRQQLVHYSELWICALGACNGTAKSHSRKIRTDIPAAVSEVRTPDVAHEIVQNRRHSRSSHVQVPRLRTHRQQGRELRSGHIGRLSWRPLSPHHFQNLLIRLEHFLQLPQSRQNN